MSTEFPYHPIPLQRSLDWVHLIESNWENFLNDHASLERKVAAKCLKFVKKYPQHTDLIDAVIMLSREELQHFHQVFKIIKSKNYNLQGDQKDPYISQLRSLCRNPPNEHLLDTLLMGSLIEARACESFRFLAQHLKDPEMKIFYGELARSEERHHFFFIKLARIYFAENEIQKRFQEMAHFEVEILKKKKTTPTVF